jgi:dipeptidyl aminopeptidase/acylaminoacyl peptidase
VGLLGICTVLSATIWGQPSGGSAESSALAALRFRFVGPPMGNRASAVAGEAGNPLVAHVGAASGGIWKTGASAAASSPRLTMEAYLGARWPSRPSVSPDGQYVSFLWTDWKTQDLYVVAIGGGPPVPLTHSVDFLGGPTWNSAGQFGTWAPDGKRLAYADGGDLYLAAVPTGATTRLTDTTDDEEGPRFSPDGTELAYARGADVYILTLATGATRQVTRDHRAGAAFSWSPDGRTIAVTIADPPARFTSAPAYSGPLLLFPWSRANARRVALVPTRGGGAIRLLPAPAAPAAEAALDWSPDGKSLLVQRSTTDAKDRSLLLVNLEGQIERTLYQQHDAKYLATNDQVAEFSPDGRSVLFTSDADGWNHLYVVPADGGAPVQITKGAFEVSFPGWTPDGRSVMFSSSEAGSAERHLYLVAAAGGALMRLTTSKGVDTTAAFSRQGDRIVFIHSDPSHLPDLWSVEARAGATPRQLTDSMTPELRAFPWQTPEIVTYSGKDGLSIKAQLFLPEGLNRRRKYPAIVNVHQASLYQEAYHGPGPQKDNVGWYGWHQRLAQLGYVVLNVDYRGSSGYGRDFRTANHLDVGVGDAVDVVKGVDYLKGLGFVDGDRVGVYGMSYGGHMVLTLLAKYPDVFRAGINIAGVLDYQIEGGPWDIRNAWVYQRLGSPEQHPEAFHNASALNFLDGIKAPILTLQGTADTNVTLLQSIKLIDELLKRGKPFEFELYPGEVHFFGRRRSWVDAFAKMERFFADYLHLENGGRLSKRS